MSSTPRAQLTVLRPQALQAGAGPQTHTQWPTLCCALLQATLHVGFVLLWLEAILLQQAVGWVLLGACTVLALGGAMCRGHRSCSQTASDMQAKCRQCEGAWTASVSRSCCALQMWPARYRL